MKSVLISIQPYYVFLIIAEAMGWKIPQKKTIEVRKTFPKDKKWNKNAAFYCSNNRKSYNRIPKEYRPLMRKFLGKVVGSFICDNADCYSTSNIGGETISTLDMITKSCLTYEELRNYEYSSVKQEGMSLIGLYGWHISNLMVYNEPKDIDNFRKPIVCHRGTQKHNCIGCWDCEIKGAPQSWCYIAAII